MGRLLVSVVDLMAHARRVVIKPSNSEFPSLLLMGTSNCSAPCVFFPGATIGPLRAWSPWVSVGERFSMREAVERCSRKDSVLQADVQYGVRGGNKDRKTEYGSFFSNELLY